MPASRQHQPAYRRRQAWQRAQLAGGHPNDVKVTVMLEELQALGHSGAEYDAWLIRINETSGGVPVLGRLNRTPDSLH